MGIFDKLKGKAKSISESAQERREHRSEVKRIRTDASRDEEKSLAKFKVREDYRRKRQDIREGKGGILGTLSGIGDSLAGGSQGGGKRREGPNLNNLILGDAGGSGRDPMSDLIFGPSNKPKTKRKKRKSSRPQPHVTVIIQEPTKRKRRKKRK